MIQMHLLNQEEKLLMMAIIIGKIFIFKMKPKLTTCNKYFRFCYLKNEVNDTTSLIKAMGSDNFTRIAIVREPIERFISGFVDKCIT